MNEYNANIREGDLYKLVVIEGQSFEIRYGYNADYERENDGEPVPVLPDLAKEPCYAKSGKRIVTFVQSPCRYFNVRCADNDNDCCGDCNYYADKKEMIAACECEEVMKENGIEYERAKGGSI